MLNDKPTLPGVTPLTNPKGKKKVGRKARQKIFCSMVGKGEKRKKKTEQQEKSSKPRIWKSTNIYIYVYIDLIKVRVRYMEGASLLAPKDKN